MEGYIFIKCINLSAGTTPDELAHVSDDGWLSTDHVSWVVNFFNSLKRDVICICPNTVVNANNNNNNFYL